MRTKGFVRKDKTLELRLRTVQPSLNLKAKKRIIEVSHIHCIVGPLLEAGIYLSGLHQVVKRGHLHTLTRAKG